MSINRYPILLLLSVVKWVSSNKSNAIIRETVTGVAIGRRHP